MARKVADGRWVVDREDDEWVPKTTPPAPAPEDDEWTLLEDHVVLREGDEWRCSIFARRWRPVVVNLIGCRIGVIAGCSECEFRRKEPAGGVGADEHSEKEPKQ